MKIVLSRPLVVLLMILLAVLGFVAAELSAAKSAAKSADDCLGKRGLIEIESSDVKVFSDSVGPAFDNYVRLDEWTRAG